MASIEILNADITELEVDVIVNAANESLLGGGGVDGAIHSAAGPQLYNECLTLNGCKTGEAKITKAYNLPCKFVIHTVGPVWKGGYHNESALLRSAYENSLKLASKNGLKTIAFPNISTGVYGFPKEKAAKIAIETIQNYINRRNKLEKIFFVVFDPYNENIYRSYLQL